MSEKQPSRAASVRIEHHRGGTSKRVQGVLDHDLRRGKQPDYIDGTKASLNSVLIEPIRYAEAKSRCEDLRGQRDTKRAMKSGVNVLSNAILTFGTEAQGVIDAMPKEQQDAVIMRVFQRLSDHIDADLTGLVVHRDESAIHAHAQVLGYTRTGHSLSASISRTTTKEMQDIIADELAPYGIERGVRKIDRIKAGEPKSAWLHRSVRELHDDLPAELEAARLKVEKAQERVAETEARLTAGLGDEDRLKKRLATYQARLEKAESAFGAMPQPVMMTRVKARQKRLFGLLPDRIETVRVPVVPAAKVHAVVVAQGEKLGARESRLASKERHIQADQEDLCQQRQALAVEREAVEKMRHEAHLAYAQASEMTKALQTEKVQQIDTKATAGPARTQAHTQAHTRDRKGGMER